MGLYWICILCLRTNRNIRYAKEECGTQFVTLQQPKAVVCTCAGSEICAEKTYSYLRMLFLDNVYECNFLVIISRLFIIAKFLVSCTVLCLYTLCDLLPNLSLQIHK